MSEVSRDRWLIVFAAGALALTLFALALDAAANGHRILDWYDLSVYLHGGALARDHPAALYSGPFHLSSSFTYTPFAALVFAPASLLPLIAARWLMTGLGLAALVFTISTTLGALGWHGRRRSAATLGLSTVMLWSWPVLRALKLGQIELALMALVVWDLCRDDERRGKGVVIGLAGAVKLVPLIFIPYLFVCRQLRAGFTALGTFAGTLLLGFLFLPRASVKWWLTGRFMHAGNAAGAQSTANQSLRGMVARAIGGLAPGELWWIFLATVVALAGLGAAMRLHRRGRLVAGWVLCAVTSLLVSPISWDHHWVWLAPGLALLTDLSVRACGRARLAWAASAAVLVATFAAWPARWSGPGAAVPGRALPTVVGSAGQTGELGALNANLYVLAGLAVLAAGVLAAADKRTGTRAFDPGGPPRGGVGRR